MGVAVDTVGNVYVTDTYRQLVGKLAAGATGATTLPFTGLSYPLGVAVDNAGNVYVADSSNRVLKLAAGATSPTALPFTGLSHPSGVAVDTAGNVYVADENNHRVLKLPAGGRSPASRTKAASLGSLTCRKVGLHRSMRRAAMIDYLKYPLRLARR
jgi:serine/threonine-protein kinase